MEVVHRNRPVLSSPEEYSVNDNVSNSTSSQMKGCFVFFFCILFAMLNGQAGCRDDVGSLLQGRRLSMQLSYSHSVQDAPVHYTVTHTPVE